MWPAPEIVTGEVYESEPADVFAFAMLAFEILTGQLPFEGKGLSRAANLIQKGDRPRFPQNAEDVGLTARMQGFLGRCWCREPTERPKIDEVVRTWERLLENDEPVRKLSIDQKRLESTSDEDYPVDVTQPPRLGKYLSSSIDIANLSMRRVTMFRLPEKKILEQVLLWIDLKAVTVVHASTCTATLPPPPSARTMRCRHGTRHFTVS